jgi:hypothetical protein
MAMVFAGGALSFGCGGEVELEESALESNYVCFAQCGRKYQQCLNNATTPEQQELCHVGYSICIEACHDPDPPYDP